MLAPLSPEWSAGPASVRGEATLKSYQFPPLMAIDCFGTTIDGGAGSTLESRSECGLNRPRDLAGQSRIFADSEHD